MSNKKLSKSDIGLLAKESGLEEAQVRWMLSLPCDAEANSSFEVSGKRSIARNNALRASPGNASQ